MPKLDAKKKLLEYIAKSLVDNPAAVKVICDQSENLSIFKLKVDPKDLGLIIGKEGKTIQAIRNLIRLQAFEKGKRIDVQLIDEEEKVKKKES